MPPTQTKFQDIWLSMVDCNKNTISEWARKVPDDPYSCFCKICNKPFSSAKGFEKIIQHAKGLKHIANISKIKSGQSRLILQPSASTLNTQQNNVLIFNPRESATRAELLWCMQTIVTDSSLKSCAEIKQLFQVMFPGAIPECFSLSPGKVQYLITEALGPYFKDKLLKDLQHDDTYFTLQFDETGNVKSKKELQIRVQFWSSVENRIVSRHLVTYFIGHASGEILFRHLLKSLDSNQLPIKKVLTLGCDGPNVNKTVVRLFEEQRKSLGLKTLINIGTCQLHNVHNAFLKGLDCLSIDISDFIMKVFYFFHHRDARCEDFEKIQKQLSLPQHKFVKHVATRWLTIGPAAERILEQLGALEEYFVRYLPKKENSTIKKEQYLNIKNYLKDVHIKVSLQFVVYAAKIFTQEFTLIMQKDEPLIHVLYSQLKKMISILLSSIFKAPVINESLSISLDIDSLLNEPTNLVNLGDVYCGEVVQELLSTLPKKDMLYFKKSVKNFYVACTKHILKKIENLDSLKYFEILSPEKIKNPKGLTFITKLAKLMPIYGIDQDNLTHEWRLLQLDNEIQFYLQPDQRIDEYWGTIFSLQSSLNKPKYPTVKLIVKAALSITHGSADVERGFSASARILTPDKAQMEERMLNAKLIVADGLKQYNNSVYKVPITGDLIKLAHGAHQSYKMYLEEKRRVAEEELKRKADEANRQVKEHALAESLQKKKQFIKELEKKLEIAIQSSKDATETCETMQHEITKILTDAVKQRDINKTVVARELQESLEKLRTEEKREIGAVDKLRQQIQKRKSDMIDSVAYKKKKY